jgi:transposase-like protein
MLINRIMREIRRHTRVVGDFPDSNSALMLWVARFRHIASIRWGQQRYLNINLLKEQELEKNFAKGAAI